MLQTANENTLLIAQVEGGEGIRNIEEILKIDGIDICFLGLYDLSNYLNVPGELENIKVLNVFSELSRKINDAGLVVGSIANNDKQVKYLIDAGVRYITYSADCQIISDAYHEILMSARAVLTKNRG